ncbi:MAG: hypothetical protein OEO19_07955 [Gammaproteobacteria bacterium]|nr:hypothetical protein [Gammaproteobacteria bacterium]MDH3450763.1 hypothetical protein [Gammaproteobacteria bacterium]
MDSPLPDKIPRLQQAISILWPSFAVAIVATGFFFSAFHPRDLVPFNLDIDVSPLAAYSIGFFLFWFLGILSSYGTMYFIISNSQALSKQQNQS